MRLKIELPEGWTQRKTRDCPTTFCRQTSSNVFQVSWAEYRGKKSLPNATPDSLKAMAMNLGEKSGFGSVVESGGGPCGYGTFGSVVFRNPQHPRVQVWFISDGRDYIMATYICDREPESDELTDVQQIAKSLALGPEHKPWWKLW
jgi:hypothetical protein